MSESTKVTKTEATNQIKEKLRSRKIKCQNSEGYTKDIINDNFSMEIRSAHYYGWSSEERNFDKVHINIKTTEYPHIRRALKDFDVTNNNYQSLIKKVKFIITEDLRIKHVKANQENKRFKNLTILKEQLTGLGAIKDEYGDGLVIQTKYFKVTFTPSEKEINIDLEDFSELSVKQAIEMINKLKG